MWSHSAIPGPSMLCALPAHDYQVRLRNKLLFCAQLLSCIQPFCDHVDCSPPGSSVHGIYHPRWLRSTEPRRMGSCTVWEAAPAAAAPRPSPRSPASTTSCPPPRCTRCVHKPPAPRPLALRVGTVLAPPGITALTLALPCPGAPPAPLTSPTPKPRPAQPCLPRPPQPHLDPPSEC